MTRRPEVAAATAHIRATNAAVAQSDATMAAISNDTAPNWTAARTAATITCRPWPNFPTVTTAAATRVNTTNAAPSFGPTTNIVEGMRSVSRHPDGQRARRRAACADRPGDQFQNMSMARSTLT